MDGSIYLLPSSCEASDMIFKLLVLVCNFVKKKVNLLFKKHVWNSTVNLDGVTFVCCIDLRPSHAVLEFFTYNYRLLQLYDDRTI